ncbi:conserved hypothetical protein [Paecilomyces variotii No. 5]|uniref:Zn(2)-C6 fungal-type domain-containing protein n=1 Tax=Byssochlamys spectabilis (strain No. 5 / NBRC 109023) TaxID=1356009 RepID=V5FY28_BYSSN|nr:conserved hypothetical protein [Paecilomyces variotii No. 5]
MANRVQKRPSATSDNNGVAHAFRESSRQSDTLGRRSCRGCHQRKVRCDRGVPCTNCSRCGISCVYPTKDREKGPNLQNVSSRLERLELLLSRLAERIEVTTGPAINAIDHGHGGNGGESQTQIQVQSGAKVNATGSANQHPSSQHSNKSTWELLLNDGKDARYMNNPDTEMTLQDEESIRSVQLTSSETAPSRLHRSADAHSDMVAEVLEYYPDAQLALQLWTVYVKSVDPVLKILHIPTVQTTVVATILDPKSARSSTVALTFAIYFAAVTALCHDSNNQSVDLPCGISVLLKRYKMAMDRLLLVTDLMNQPEMTALQALAIYITCLRVHEIGRSVWVLNGLAIRLAQSIGLHRDGASSQLSPFETEMRLRLWWHLCVLDSRAPEDQGFQPTVDVMNRELRLPLNVNDNQICPDMTRLPEESDGWTEMSFFLIQTESCRLLHPILDTPGQHSADTLLDIAAKRKVIEEHGEYLFAKYSTSSGSSTPIELSRIAMQHVTTAARKMKFVLQLREEISKAKQKGTREDSTPDVLKPSFKLACESLESNYLLLKEGLASRFKWFFNIYTPWYTLAYVLRCLCSSPCGFETERAWVLVEELFPRGMNFHGHSAGIHDEYGNSSIWRCLNVLRYKALSSRQQAQLSVATANVDIHPSSSNEHGTSRLLPDTENRTTTTAHGMSTLSNLDQEFTADFDPSFFSSLDLSMPDIPFLSDWNAVINGCIDDDGHSSLL